MKKVITLIVSALMLVSLCACLTACSANYVGTYHFEKMSMDMGGMSMDVEAGKEFQGVTIKEDAIVLKVNDDNTWSFEMNIMGSAQTQKGTWEVKDGALQLKDEATGEVQSVKKDGDKLVMSANQDGASATITFKKA